MGWTVQTVVASRAAIVNAQHTVQQTVRDLYRLPGESHAVTLRRGAAGGATNGAYYFEWFSNVVEMDSLFCIDRQLGFEFFNACDGLQLRNCSIEGGVNGMYFGSETNKLTIDNCYFENLTGTVLDFSVVAGHRNITVSNCFFNLLPIASTIISGVQMGSGSVFSKTNHITVSMLKEIKAWISRKIDEKNR